MTTHSTAPGNGAVLPPRHRELQSLSPPLLADLCPLLAPCDHGPSTQDGTQDELELIQSAIGGECKMNGPVEAP